MTPKTSPPVYTHLCDCGRIVTTVTRLGRVARLTLRIDYPG